MSTCVHHESEEQQTKIKLIFPVCQCFKNGLKKLHFQKLRSAQGIFDTILVQNNIYCRSSRHAPQLTAMIQPRATGHTIALSTACIDIQ